MFLDLPPKGFVNAGAKSFRDLVALNWASEFFSFVVMCQRRMFCKKREMFASKNRIWGGYENAIQYPQGALCLGTVYPTKQYYMLYLAARLRFLCIRAKWHLCEGIL